MRRRKKETDEEREKREEEWRRQQEATERGRLNLLLKDFEIPWSFYNPVNGYVKGQSVELLRPILNEWKELKSQTNLVEAKQELERWKNRVNELERRLNEIRRIVK